MKSVKLGKIVFYKEFKEFVGYDGESELEDALLYPIDLTDEEIKEEFDINFRDKIEIWKVRKIIETIP